tara:strand:+ start:2170 stop:2415 length:246 start_codon:yes stop_codon:yes gene_type:complete
LGRRKSCPKEVKKALDKLKRAKEMSTKASKEWAEFKNKNKEFMKTFNKLRSNKWNKWRGVTRAERDMDALPTLILVREFSK